MQNEGGIASVQSKVWKEDVHSISVTLDEPSEEPEDGTQLVIAVLFEVDELTIRERLTT